MTIQSFNGRFFSGGVRTALAAGALLALSVPSLWAKLPSTKEVAALASGTISSLIAADDPNFAADAATAIDSLAVTDLSVADDEAIVKAALGTISDAIASGTTALTSATLLSGDESIAAKLAADTTLEGVSKPKDALTIILATAMPGINGVKGLSQTVAPEAAESFVEGLVASVVPNDLPLPGLAVAILAKVSKNTSVDELVAYQVGLKDNATQADLVTLAASLFHAYPTAAIKVTQGVTAVTPAGNNNETNRIAFIQALVTAQEKDAAGIAQGAVFVDPFYAGGFTGGIFAAILAEPTVGRTTGDKLLERAAAGIAKGVGATLGQDGGVLTQVADVYSEAIGEGNLPVADAAAYTTDLLKGAITSKVPASEFTGAAAGAGGGQLNVGAGVTFATVTDLASILDLMATGILTADASLIGSGAKGVSKTASAVGVLAEAVAKFTKSELITDPNDAGDSGPIASFLAASLAHQVAELVPAGDLSVFLADIDKDVDKDVTSPLRSEIATEVSLNGSYPVVGAIATPETAITNL